MNKIVRNSKTSDPLLQNNNNTNTNNNNNNNNNNKINKIQVKI